MNKEIYDIDRDNLEKPTFKDCEDNSQNLNTRHNNNYQQEHIINDDRDINRCDELNDYGNEDNNQIRN